MRWLRALGLGLCLGGSVYVGCMPRDFSFEEASTGDAAQAQSSASSGASSTSTTTSSSSAAASSSSGASSSSSAGSSSSSSGMGWGGMGGGGMGGGGMGGGGMGGSGMGGSNAGGSNAGGSNAGGSGSASSSGSGGPVCGDGVVMQPEACDDGNMVDDDACSSDCLCGDGVAGTIAFTDAATGHCYAAYQGAAPWFDASMACQNKGGYLATLTSQEEVDYVSIHAAAIVDLWIGAQDLGIEGQWVWENGEPWLMSPCTVEPTCDPAINLWGMDQPDDYMMVEDCGLLWTYAFALNDYTCDSFLPYLCERSP